MFGFFVKGIVCILLLLSGPKAYTQAWLSPEVKDSVLKWRNSFNEYSPKDLDEQKIRVLSSIEEVYKVIDNEIPNEDLKAELGLTALRTQLSQNNLLSNPREKSKFLIAIHHKLLQCGPYMETKEAIGLRKELVLLISIHRNFFDNDNIQELFIKQIDVIADNLNLEFKADVYAARIQLENALVWLEERAQAKELLAWHRKFLQHPNVDFAVPADRIVNLLSFDINQDMPINKVQDGMQITGSGKASLVTAGSFIPDTDRLSIGIIAKGLATSQTNATKAVIGRQAKVCMNTSTNLEVCIPIYIDSKFKLGVMDADVTSKTTARVNSASLGARTRIMRNLGSSLVRRVAEKNIPKIESGADKELKDQIQSEFKKQALNYLDSVNGTLEEAFLESLIMTDSMPTIQWITSKDKLVGSASFHTKNLPSAYTKAGCDNSSGLIRICLHESSLNNAISLIEGQKVREDELTNFLFSPVFKYNPDNVQESHPLATVVFADDNAFQVRIKKEGLMFQIQLKSFEYLRTNYELPIKIIARYKPVLTPEQDLQLNRIGGFEVTTEPGYEGKLEELKNVVGNIFARIFVEDVMSLKTNFKFTVKDINRTIDFEMKELELDDFGWMKIGFKLESTVEKQKGSEP